jgi:hypothetical protein
VLLCACSLAALSGKASTSNVDKDNYYTDDYYKYEVRQAAAQPGIKQQQTVLDKYGS